MTPTLRLGRVAGVPLGAHWSVLAVLVLIADGLAGGVLPDAVPGHPAGAYWAVAVVVAVLFLGGLLAHEVAHAVVARHYAVPVQSITLWMLGGVARLGTEPPTARADLAVAAAGPLTSVAAGAAFGAVAWLAGLLGAPRLVVAGAGWLAGTNLLLAVFNLLPGAPLDGGRVLRAVIWLRTGDRARAAGAAARTGRVLGAALVGVGAWMALVSGQPVGGLWLALLGWFLLNAATAEAVSERTAQALAGVRVGELVSRDVPVLPAYLPLDRAAATLAEGGYDACPVVRLDGTPVGVVTPVDLLRVPAERAPALRVSDLRSVTRRRTVADVDDFVVEVLRGGRDPLPAVVQEHGRVVGVLTRAGVTTALRGSALRSRA